MKNSLLGATATEKLKPGERRLSETGRSTLNSPAAAADADATAAALYSMCVLSPWQRDLIALSWPTSL